MATGVAADQIRPRGHVETAHTLAPCKEAQIDSEGDWGRIRLPGRVGRLCGVHTPETIPGQALVAAEKELRSGGGDGKLDGTTA